MKTAVVLFNLGGPDSLQAVRPFLFNLFNDPAIIGAPAPIRYLIARLISGRRTRIAQDIYSKIGGRSPILPETEAQASVLQSVLQAEPGNDEWRCFIAMRYWHPRAAAVARDLRAWGAERVVLLPLYPQFSTTTTQSSLDEWRGEAKTAGLDVPTTAVCCYYANAGWIEALAAAVRPALEKLQDGPTPRLLLSAHGLPKRVVERGDPYQWQVERTAEALIGRLAGLNFDPVVCYQSRVGPLEWIGPATDDTIRQAAADGRPVVVAPVAFVSEHSETLVELDIEYRHLAESLGVKSYTRIATVNVAAAFIGGLAGLVRKAAAATGVVSDMEQACPQAQTRCARLARSF